MEVENVLEKLGIYGRYQIVIYTIWSLASGIPFAFQALAIVFIGGIPNNGCKLDQGQTVIVSTTNGVNNTDTCNIYDSQKGSNVPCTAWIYNDTDIGSTIVSEFDLVCSRAWMNDFTQTLYMIGEIIGAFIVAPFADRFGRKVVNLVCMVFLILSTIGAGYSPNYTCFAILRVINGITMCGVALTAIVAALELFPIKSRTFAGQFFYVWWALGMMFYNLVAYLVRSWSNIQMIMGLVPIPFMAVVWYVCPESIVWYLANDKVEQAEEIVLKAAKYNKVSLPEHPLAGYSKDDGANEEESFKNSIKLIFTNRRLRFIVLLTFLIWFANGIIYYGLTLSSPVLTDNRFLNFFVSALAEIPSCICGIFILSRYGRIKPLCIYHIIVGVCAFALAVIPQKTADGTDISWLIIIVYFVAKFTITASFNAIIQYTMEVFPTNIRNTGLGMDSMACRLGSSLSTFSLVLYQQLPWLPNTIFGILSILVGLIVLLLPESFRHPLPQSIKDLESWTMPAQKCCKRPHVEPITPVPMDTKTRY